MVKQKKKGINLYAKGLDFSLIINQGIFCFFLQEKTGYEFKEDNPRIG